MNIIDKIGLKLKEKGEAYFNVKVRPSAAISRIVEELADETIKIDLAAPAREGQANAELIKFLAKELAVSRASIKIVSGKTSRDKLIKIEI
jgi:uncharacterized protein (TIGR00251 family)